MADKKIVKGRQVIEFEKWAQAEVPELNLSCGNVTGRFYDKEETQEIFNGWKKGSKKPPAIDSARYILRELYENGDVGIKALSSITNLPEGVISAAFENIFSK